MWQTFSEPAGRLIVQAFQLVEQICPSDPEEAKTFWIELNALLARELGSRALSATSPIGVHYTMKSWMLERFSTFSGSSADLFVKERLSLVELGFRNREEAMAKTRSKISDRIAFYTEVIEQQVSAGTMDAAAMVYGDLKRTQAELISLNAPFQEAIDELNVRFQLAGVDLHYHNGFIQIATDKPIEQQIEEPFWHW